MYNQQVEIYSRGFIKKVVVDIASLTGRRFDLMQKPLILKVHLWALGKTKCLLIKWCCSSVYAKGGQLCTMHLKYAVYARQDWKTKLGKDPQGRADNKDFAPREQQSLFEKYVKELGFQIEQDFRSLMDQVKHAWY